MALCPIRIQTTRKRSCSLSPLLPVRKRFVKKTGPLGDDRSSPSWYLSTPSYDLQASDHERDVVNSVSARSGEEALGFASLTAQVKGSLYQAPSGPIRCRFCPLRAFTKASQVHRHTTLCHLSKSFCVCSGKKPQRAIFALRDSDSPSGVQPFELLARSALFIG